MGNLNSFIFFKSMQIQLQVILLKEKDCQYFTFYAVAFALKMFCFSHLLSVKILSL